MKILVLQLARFGDIFLTWPVLRALRRKHPRAEIHLVVRKRFSAAAEGLSAVEGLSVVDRVWTLDTAKILGPLILNEEGADGSLARLGEWMSLLGERDFDQVINLSFSPFSSYLTSLVSGIQTKVRGYSRHGDGFLAIPDDPSSYFYAQVGPGRSNRFHLADLMAAVADVELQSDDWGLPLSWSGVASRWPHSVPYICLHPGASQNFKVYPAFKWRRIIHQFLKDGRYGVALIGGRENRDEANEILAGAPSEWVGNFCGHTTFQESAALIRQSRLVVGADSAPMHLASHLNVKCLNLSFDGVQFWETGPRAVGSCILATKRSEDLPSEVVSDLLNSMMGGASATFSFYERTNHGPVAYQLRNKNSSPEDEFPWRLTLALYTAESRPRLISAQQAQALVQIHELAKIALDQVDALKKEPKSKVAVEILSQVDMALHTVAQLVPSWRPLVAWFETEKVRMGPGAWQDLCDKFEDIYGQLFVVTDDWLVAEKSTPRDPQEVLS